MLLDRSMFGTQDLDMYRLDVKRALASGFISVGGIEWAAATTGAVITGSSGLEGAPGLLLIGLGLWMETHAHNPHARYSLPERSVAVVGVVLVAVGLRAELWLPIWGLVSLLILPTIFVLGPSLLSAWALRSQPGTDVTAPRVVAAAMLAASTSSLVMSESEPAVSSTLAVAFGLLAVALGLARYKPRGSTRVWT